MENSFQTSFIPKKPITSDVVSKSSTNFFSVISIIILIIVAFGSGGLYLYNNYLVNQLNSKSESLKKASDDFEKDTIDKLTLFDKRSSASKQILSSHIVLSPMFKLLGDLTIPSIQYTKFSHDTTDKGFVVKMSGIATDYKSIALQADVFNSDQGRSFKSVVFSNLNKDKDGGINFDITFTVDPSLLSYEKDVLIENAQQAKSSSMQGTNNLVDPQKPSQAQPTPANSTPDTSSLNNKTQ